MYIIICDHQSRFDAWDQVLRLVHWVQDRRKQCTSVLLPGKSRGQRSLVGCSPWGRWGLDMTERLHFQFSLSCIGEGNGNPLQCSGLENPRDGRAWWAAVYGVAQSRTRLKWLSSSSNEAAACYWHGHSSELALMIFSSLCSLSLEWSSALFNLIEILAFLQGML